MKMVYAAMHDNKSGIQFLRNQITELGIKQSFIDPSSSKDTSKTEFQLMLEKIQLGDKVIVMTLNHLGKNYHEIHDRVISIHSKKAQLVVTDAHFLDFETGNQQFNELGFQLFVDLLEEIPRIKRVWNKERHLQGIQQAKEKGIYKGKPTTYSADTENPKNRATYFQIKSMLMSGFPIATIKKMTGVTRSTIYRIKKELEQT